MLVDNHLHITAYLSRQKKKPEFHKKTSDLAALIRIISVIMINVYCIYQHALMSCRVVVGPVERLKSVFLMVCR